MTSQINARREEWPPRIDELQREMERFFTHLHAGKRPRVQFSTAAWSPHVDVYETEDKAVVLVDLAGVPREEIQIEVEHDHLTLRGERRPPHREDARVFYALEVSYGAFERTVHLPFAVNSGQAQASYRDGFLEIVLPRVAPQQPTRVNIRSTEQTEQ